MAANLPASTFFRSAAPIHDEDGDGYLIGYHLQYECHNKLVNIVFLSSVGPEDDGYLNPVKAEDKLLEKYDKATMSSQHGPDAEAAVMEREEAVHEEIRGWVEGLCRPTFLELARTSTHVKASEPMSLFQYLHPEVVNVQIATQDDGELRVIRYGNDHPLPWPDSVQPTLFTLTKSILTSSDHENDLPSYSPKQIILVEAAAVPKVVVEEEGQIMCCKPNTRDYATTKEYTRLKKIKDAGLDSLRVPSLRGLVTEEGGVIGLLLEFIEPKYSTLSAAMGEERAYYAPGVQPEKPSQSRKTKWARQIQQTVHQLHDIDVVWGDAKPDNILIDKEDNAWVLDFGGGWTVGWVDEDLADTKEGDLQGLEKMLKYLGVRDDEESKPEQPEPDRAAKKQKRRHSIDTEGCSNNAN